MRDYEKRWNRFKSFLEEKRPDIAFPGEIDREAMQSHTEILIACDSPATFNDNIAMAAIIVRTLAADAGLEENPFALIRKKKAVIIHKKELAEAEAIRLLAVFGKEEFVLPDKEEMRLCFHVGMFSGLRFPDAVNLRFDEVYFDEGLIWMTPEKTSAYQESVSG